MLANKHYFDELFFSVNRLMANIHVTTSTEHTNITWNFVVSKTRWKTRTCSIMKTSKYKGLTSLKLLRLFRCCQTVNSWY
ncbi:hypothetical protein GDO81_013733 [Engystomops pustulosus]|uniref:Uncharacterized protein n=1 Tax=Engystomops pustulosus TaxID=76066 RepID=A0AAV7B553_ENGPU|nr:hypothetical protein GDO81_013733 [Engystomops pustulosus]